jgi:hypothetical protein
LILWSGVAHAHKNPPNAVPIPAEVEQCVSELLVKVTDKPEGSSPAKQIVQEKIAARVSRLDRDNVLISDRVQDDGRLETPIKAGMTRLFLREVIVKMVRDTSLELTNIAKEWVKARKPIIEKEQKASAATRAFVKGGAFVPALIPNSDGVFETAFIKKYMPQMERMLQSMSEEDRKKLSTRGTGGAGTQETRLKVFLFEDLTTNLTIQKNKNAEALASTLLYQHNKVLNDTTQAMVESITDRYLRGEVHEPEFALIEKVLQQTVDNFIDVLKQRYPLEADAPIAHVKAPKAEDYVEQKDGIFTLTFSDAVATYEPSIASLVLRSIRKSNIPSLLNVVQLHGTGTNRSNAASWHTLFPRAIQAGADPYAINLPGAAGTNGIGLNSVRTAGEMDAYLRMSYDWVEKNAQDKSLPMVVMGRSMGATEAAMHMLYGPMNGLPLPADLLYMMSFSNPDTIELQTQNLLVQLEKGQLQGIVKSALDHAVGLTTDFKRNLHVVRPQDLSLAEKQVQDIGILAQGEADQDGVIAGSNIIAELKGVRDQHFPFAHVYPFEAPQIKYGDAWFDKYKIDPMMSEATHFLQLTLPNFTNENRHLLSKVDTSDIPESDLPKLEDQHHETYAVAFAMLDYQIDLSPITDPNRREALREQRRKATGDDRQFAYLRWFVNHVVNPRQLKILPEQRLTLDQIVGNPSIQPNRAFGAYGRMKKVYLFALSEQKRILELLAH